MTELKDTERELHRFRVRLSVAGAVVFVFFACLLARFVWLQVFKHNDYVAQAEENRISVVPIVPNRGLMLDRNGVVLARNYSAYTLEITPSKINGKLDQIIDELSTLVEITPRDRSRFKKLREESRNLGSSPIRVRLTDEEVARFSAQRYRFPGVEVQARLFRQYPLGETASHVIGYIGRTAGTLDTTVAGAITIDVTDPAGTTTTTTINFAADATIDDINKSIKEAGIEGLSVGNDGSQLYFANRSENDIDVDATAAGFTAAVALAAGTASDKAILDKNYDYFDGTAFQTVSVSTIDISKLTDSADDLKVLEQYVEIVDKALADVTQSSADLGAIKTRIDSNSNFVKSLRDAIDRGVGQLVDADMNAESTRLQALQVQQQLGIQALSIANSTSQSILQLFQ